MPIKYVSIACALMLLVTGAWADRPKTRTSRKAFYPKSIVQKTGKIGNYASLRTNGVAIRGSASEKGKLIARASKGESGWVLGYQGNWLKVDLAPGKVGWVRRDMLQRAEIAKPANKPALVAKAKPAKKPSVVKSKPKPTGSLESLLARAHSFRGTRYRYGSASRSATDCSGFTQQVFASQGVRLPRTSMEQSRVGQAVSRGRLRAGDLVFFRTRGSRVSHVGIFLGGSRFIHASNPRGGVRVDSMSGYYGARYAGARRVGDFTAKKAEVIVRQAEQIEVEQVTEPTVDPAPEVPFLGSPDGH